MVILFNCSVFQLSSCLTAVGQYHQSSALKVKLFYNFNDHLKFPFLSITLGFVSWCTYKTSLSQTHSQGPWCLTVDLPLRFFQELSVMDDTVLQTHRVNPKLIQVILLANGRPFIKTISYAWTALTCTACAYIVNENQTLRIIFSKSLKNSVNIDEKKKCHCKTSGLIST